MAASLDFITQVRTESSRFAECLASADRSARVPTCPDWDVADLLWHLTEVQLFWGTIVRDRLDGPDGAEATKPERPEDFDALLALFDGATAALVDALTTTPGATTVWTWWHPDQSASFVGRRQAHEALIHRLDAELIVGDTTPVDRDLASDGVDEALRIMYGDAPLLPWGVFTPDGTTGAVETNDTHATWNFGLGRFVGTSPDSGTHYDLETINVLDDASTAPVFTVRGTSADLDAWLWGRGPVDRLEIDGDHAAFERFAAVISRGVD